MKIYGECSAGVRFRVEELIFRENEIIAYCNFANCPLKDDCKEMGQVTYQIKPLSNLKGGIEDEKIFL